MGRAQHCVTVSKLSYNTEKGETLVLSVGGSKIAHLPRMCRARLDRALGASLIVNKVYRLPAASERNRPNVFVVVSKRTRGVAKYG